MRLQEYQYLMNIHLYDIINKIGVCSLTLNSYILQKKRPPVEVAEKIEEFTGGLVSVMELLFEKEKYSEMTFEQKKDSLIKARKQLKEKLKRDACVDQNCS